MVENLTRKIQYEFKSPPEGYNAVYDWVIGQDQVSRNVLTKLKYVPSDADIENAIRTVRREPKALNSVHEIWGRVAQIPTVNPIQILGTSYDMLELGGFGAQKLFIENDASARFSTADPIELPSSENFAQKMPTLTRTSVIDQGREIILGDSFSFTGAYTAEQISKKVAANMFVLNKLAGLDTPPFIVPVPIAIGHYPTVKNDKGRHAFFVVFLVPYGGKRTGNFHFDGQDAEALKNYVTNLIDGTSFTSRALSYLSNTFGLTHNQPHSSNTYSPEVGLFYLADFSTVYPLYAKKQDKARARELRRLMESVWKRYKTFFGESDESRVAQYLFRKILSGYLGENVLVPMPDKIIYAEPFFEALFANLITSGKLPKQMPTEESWGKITTLEKTIRSIIRKSAGEK